MNEHICNIAKMREALEFADRELRMATEDNRYGEDLVSLVLALRHIRKQVAVMKSINEIHALRLLCEEYGLEGRSILIKYYAAELAAIFNGIGPDIFPQWLRALLDELHPSLLPVALIHDVEWYESDGTAKSFDASNARFRRNGKTVAKKRFAWYNPRRYLVIWDACRFANACQTFGLATWVECFKNRNEGK